MVQRWHQLPLDRALSYADRVHALAQTLADQVAEATGVAASEVPDCGPATLMDQLVVLVYDASVAASSTGTSTPTSTALASTALTSALGRDLASLRSELR